ncbi:hypothetical protein [Pseudomonas sp. SDI]|uniref:hypothetical protein n=1 Tax=Pseudomonas sp. SDI TaxID=2170734 RepID=UPI001057CCA3|nr:hypothetical protein [Pseudomonas sp. SDI]
MGDHVNDFLINVMDFGAAGNGEHNDTPAFNTAISKATETGGKVVAVGRFKIQGYLTVTADCDFSQACFIVDDAAININYTKDYLSSNQRVIDEIHIKDKSSLTELQASLKEVLPDEIIENYENSYVRIQTNVQAKGAPAESEVYIYRGDGSPQLRSTVTFMYKYGRLAYPLNHNYVDVPSVSITLRKIPEKRLTFVSPSFEVINFPKDKGPLLSVNRDLVTIQNLTLSHIPGGSVPVDSYYAMTRVSGCYDVDFINSTFPGYGKTNSEVGVGQDVKYDFVFDNALKLKLDNINSSTAWKTLDGNSSRDIKIFNAHLYGFHGHFNVADVLLEGCRIYTGGVMVGTGAQGSSLTVRNCYFESVFGNAVGLRGDYGELRGNILIENCHLEMSSLTLSGRTCSILDLSETCISRRDQPNTYSLPENITIQNVTVNCKQDCHVIKLNDNNSIYSSKRKLNAPKNIHTSNININSSNHGNLIFEYRFIPYNNTASSPVRYSILNCSSTTGKTQVSFWGSTSTLQDMLQYILQVTSVSNASFLLVAGNKSEVRINNCDCIYFDNYNAGSSCLRLLHVDCCTFRFDNSYEDGQTFQVSKKIKSIFSAIVFLTPNGEIKKTSLA